MRTAKMRIPFASAIGFLLFSEISLADIGKQALFMDGISVHVDPRLWAHLTSTQSTTEQ